MLHANLNKLIPERMDRISWKIHKLGMRAYQLVSLTQFQLPVYGGFRLESCDSLRFRALNMSTYSALFIWWKCDKRGCLFCIYFRLSTYGKYCHDLDLTMFSIIWACYYITNLLFVFNFTFLNCSSNVFFFCIQWRLIRISDIKKDGLKL